MAETSHARTVLDAQRFVNGDRVSPTCQKSLRMMDHDSPKTRIDRSLELGIISLQHLRQRGVNGAASNDFVWID